MTRLGDHCPKCNRPFSNVVRNMTADRISVRRDGYSYDGPSMISWVARCGRCGNVEREELRMGERVAV